MITSNNDISLLDYNIAGGGDVTLLFVHGAFINQTYWNAQVEYFKKQFRVITIDLAGHGKSGANMKDGSIQTMGEDLVEFINKMELSKIILIGHSMGGDVILEAATRIHGKIIGFIGIDNFKNAGTAFPEEIQKQTNLIIKSLKEDFSNTSEAFARQALLTASTDPEIRQRVINDYRNFKKEWAVKIISSSFSYYLMERELLQQLKLKLYLINVDYFPMNEAPLKIYPKSGYKVFNIHGSCHYPMIEVPSEFNLVLEEIIKKIVNNK
jgi:sigma-B regulation protein RsbQ